MLLVLIGFSLVFIDVGITFGVHYIDFAPDFAGYILLIAGFSQLSGESRRLKKLRGFATFMVIYSAAVFLLDALGLTVVGLGAWKGIIDIAAFFVPLYIVYVFIYAVHDIEVDRGADLGYKKLLKLFTPLAIAQALAYFFGVAFTKMFYDLAWAISLVSSAISVVFLYFLYKTKTAYDSLPPKDEGGDHFGDEDKKKTIWEQYN